MLAYYGYTISPNQIETGEGFLICRNVPIARTGEQEYAGNDRHGQAGQKIIEFFHHGSSFCMAYVSA